MILVFQQRSKIVAMTNYSFVALGSEISQNQHLKLTQQKSPEPPPKKKHDKNHRKKPESELKLVQTTLSCFAKPPCLHGGALRRYEQGILARPELRGRRPGGSRWGRKERMVEGGKRFFIFQEVFLLQEVIFWNVFLFFSSPKRSFFLFWKDVLSQEVLSWTDLFCLFLFEKKVTGQKIWKWAVVPWFWRMASIKD